MEKENCIILNKPFIGGYIDRSNENEAHELINFFLDDNGNHFIYCNPYGQNVKDAKNKNIEYLIFTSVTKNKFFYIEYVIKIKKTLHDQSMPKAAEKFHDKIDKSVDSAIKEINKNVETEGYKGLEEIKYGGIPIIELFTDTIKVIPITFLAEEIYKVKKPIKVGNSESDSLFDYNFQRNFGYVTEKTKKPAAYKKLKDLIKTAIKDDEVCESLKLERFNPSKQIDIAKSTFIDLISMFRQEECYTQILFKLFKYKKEYITEFLKFSAKNKQELSESIKRLNIIDKLDIKAEYSIDKVGRLDLYAFNGEINVIIENKVDSGINCVKRENLSKDQLTRYYEYFEEQKPGKNIYIILAPNEKLSYLEAEIGNLSTQQTIKKAYIIIGYDIVHDFFKEKTNEIKGFNFEYGRYIDDIVEIFRRLSLTRQKICEENLLNNINRKNNKYPKIST